MRKRGILGALALAFLFHHAPAEFEDLRLPASGFGEVVIKLPQSLSHLERVLGRHDNFEPLALFSPDSRFRRLGAPIGLLDMVAEDADGKYRGVCTGWLISGEYMLTNHHCIPGQRGRVIAAELRLGYLSTDDVAGVRRFAVDINPIETNAQLDYSVLRVSGNPSALFGAVAFTPRAPRPGEDLFIIQHPAGQPQRLTRKDCRVKRIRSAEGDFSHTCDTMGGSSGSPIFAEDGTAVGLHFAGYSTENYGKRLTDIQRNSKILAAKTATSPSTAGPTPRATPAPSPPPIAAIPPVNSANAIPRIPIGDDIARHLGPDVKLREEKGKRVIQYRQQLFGEEFDVSQEISAHNRASDTVFSQYEKFGTSNFPSPSLGAVERRCARDRIDSLIGQMGGAWKLVPTSVEPTTRDAAPERGEEALREACRTHRAEDCVETSSVTETRYVFSFPDGSRATVKFVFTENKLGGRRPPNPAWFTALLYYSRSCHLALHLSKQ